MRRVLKPVQDSLAGAVSLPSSSSTTEKSKMMKGGHGVSASSRTNNRVVGGRTTVISDATPTRGGVLAAAAAASAAVPISSLASIPDGAAADSSLQNLAVGRRPSNKSKSEAVVGGDTLLLATGGDGAGGFGGLSIRDSDKLRPGGVGGKRQSRRRGSNKNEEQKVTVATKRDANVENVAPGPALEPTQFHPTRQPTAATFTSLMAAEVANSTTDGGRAQGSGTASMHVPSAGSSNNGNVGEHKAKKRMRRGVRGGRNRSARTRQSGGGGALGALGMTMTAAIGDRAAKNEKKKKGNSKRNIGGTLAAEPQPPTSTVPPGTTRPNMAAEEMPASSVLATLDLSMMSLDRSQEGVEEINAGGGILGQTAVAAKKVSPSPAIPVTVEHGSVEIVDTGASSLPSGEGSKSQPVSDGVEAMDIDIDETDSLAMESAQESAEPCNQDAMPPPPPCPEIVMMRSPISSKKMLKSKRQRKQSFSPPAVQIRKVFSAAAARASTVAPSSTFANWGSPSPRPKPSKRVDKKKTPVVVSKLEDEFMAEESPRAAAGPSPDASVPMSPIVKAPAPVKSPLVDAKKSVATAPIGNSNVGGNKIGGSKVLAVSPAEYNSSQFEANAIATRLFEDVKDTAIRNVLARSNTNTKVSGDVPKAAGGSSTKGSTKYGPGSMVLDVQAAASPKVIHVAGNEEFGCVEDSRTSMNDEGVDESTSIPKVQKNGKAKKVAVKSKSKKKNQGKKESKQDTNGSEGLIAAAVAAATAADSSTNHRPRRQAKKVNRLSVSWNDTTYQEKSNKGMYDGCSDDGEDGDDAFAEYEQMCKTQKEKAKKKQTSPSPPPEKSKRRGSLKKGIKSVAAKGKDKQKTSAKAKASRSKNDDSTGEDQLSPGSTWSSEQVQALRKAYHAVEPTSFCFWEDVASGLDDGKTAEQCRDKWFSLVQTPKIRAKKKGARNSNGGGQRSGRKTPAAIRKDVDDLFQSTPYRRVNVNFDEDGDDSGKSCDESEGFIGDDDVMLPCEFGSPISHSPSKMVNQAAAEADKDGDGDNGHDMSLIHFLTGYKGYIKGLAKIRRRNGGKRRGGGGGANAALTPAIKDKSGRNVSAKIGAGDVQMNGVLTPGGTIQVRAPTDSDLEDLVIRPGEEFSDDEESIAKENAELEV